MALLKGIDEVFTVLETITVKNRMHLVVVCCGAAGIHLSSKIFGL